MVYYFGSTFRIKRYTIVLLFSIALGGLTVAKRKSSWLNGMIVGATMRLRVGSVNLHS